MTFVLEAIAQKNGGVPRKRKGSFTDLLGTLRGRGMKIEKG